MDRVKQGTIMAQESTHVYGPVASSFAGYEKRRGSMYDQSLVDTFNSAPPTRELASRGV